MITYPEIREDIAWLRATEVAFRRMGKAMEEHQKEHPDDAAFFTLDGIEYTAKAQIERADRCARIAGALSTTEYLQNLFSEIDATVNAVSAPKKEDAGG